MPPRNADPRRAGRRRGPPALGRDGAPGRGDRLIAARRTGPAAAGTLPLAALALAAPGLSRGDDWPAPQTREVFAPAREYVVRVIPGKGIGETVGFRGAPTGPPATAELHRRAGDGSYHPVWTMSLVNEVVALYSPAGALVRAYALADLFSAAEIGALRRSVSSIWWRKAPAYVRPDQQTLYVPIDGAGRELLFEIETGAYQ